MYKNLTPHTTEEGLLNYTVAHVVKHITEDSTTELPTFDPIKHSRFGTKAAGREKRNNCKVAMLNGNIQLPMSKMLRTLYCLHAGNEAGLDSWLCAFLLQAQNLLY